MTELERINTDLNSHHIEGFAVHGDTPFSVPLISHITGNLWTGGCSDGVRLSDDFEYVVSLYPWERYELGPHTERLEIEMYDSDEEIDTRLLLDLGQLVNIYRSEGKTLVHCQAGLNRSALVAATALILDGETPDAAIQLLRERRSPAVLCNPTFEAWLRNGSVSLAGGVR